MIGDANAVLLDVLRLSRGTINTAIWLPFAFSKAASSLSMRLTAPPESVPVRSTTRPVRGGTATSPWREAREAQAAKARARRARSGWSLDGQCDGAAVGATARARQSTASRQGRCGRRKIHRRGLEMAASFSTVKLGFGL